MRLRSNNSCKSSHREELLDSGEIFFETMTNCLSIGSTRPSGKKCLPRSLRIKTCELTTVEFGDGWGLVRASNTQPVLVVRFEARTAQRLEEIRAIFMEPLRRLGVGEAAVGH